MSRSLSGSLRSIKGSLLAVFLVFFISGCGGSGGGTATPTVSLLVSLFDQLSGGSPSGDKVNISEVGGSINFTCYQSEQNQDVVVDSRCEIAASTSNSSGSGSSIRFNSLPTERTYILTHFDSVDVSNGNCSVEIQSSSALVAQPPCAKSGDNAVTMTLNTGITPNN